MCVCVCTCVYVCVCACVYVRVCVCIQVLKLQESPDAVPKGEMPRHMQLYLDRYLTDKIVPGNRIMVVGIYSIRKSGTKPPKVTTA